MADPATATPLENAQALAAELAARRLCQCGCGQPTRRARATIPSRGWIFGQPVRFLHGHGTRVNNPRTRVPAIQRFMAKVRRDGACWRWTGATVQGKSKTLYGMVRVDGKTQLAHRWAYTTFRGPIADGLTVDHLCANTLCVNPEHLEAVSNQENVRRGFERRAHTCQN